MHAFPWKQLLPWLVGYCCVLGLGFWLMASADNGREGLELLNVSYDPTRELWKELNGQFTADYWQMAGQHLSIKMSHGGSASQARAVIDGLSADVVTLALWNDIDVLRAKGLIKPGWESRLSDNSAPYYSTIVFVVRKGNPKGIRDWADLTRDGIQVITPNPKTSGNGRLSFLAAWGQEHAKNRSEEAALAYVTKLYHQVPVLDTAARGSTATFALRKIGDVHLTWENEAHLEIQERPGEMEIVYPSSSIRAEPPVAVVDANVDRKGTRSAAVAYLKYLYSEEAQETVAKHHFRPSNPKILERHAATFPAIRLFAISAFAADWDEAQNKFFANGAVFDSIYRPKPVVSGQ